MSEGTGSSFCRFVGNPSRPYFLPDGNHFSFVAALLGPISEDNAFYVGALDGKPSRILAHGSSPIAYASGHVLYLVGNTPVARPFDRDKLEFTGQPVSLAEGVRSDPMFSNAVFRYLKVASCCINQGRELTRIPCCCRPNGKTPGKQRRIVGWFVGKREARFGVDCPPYGNGRLSDNFGFAAREESPNRLVDRIRSRAERRAGA